MQKLKLLSLSLCLFYLGINQSVAENLKVVVGLTKPPYVIEDKQSGYELELIQLIFQHMGKQAEFVFLPFGRHAKMLEDGMFDAIMTVNERIIPNQKLLTNTYITYQNVAISLSQHDLTINSIADLTTKRLAAFKLANKLLGRKFSQAVEVSSLYLEISDQRQQTQLLFKHKVEVLIMDINIFNYFTSQLQQADKPNQIKVHPIFSKSPYQMAFSDPKLVPHFNHALAQIKESPQYQTLQTKYKLVQIN